jgi:arabinofuranan 3-O-arabinosyltransferase
MRSDALLNLYRTEPDKLILAMALGISLGYAGALAVTFFAHVWILDTHGQPVVEDFVAFWTAGHQVLKGAPVAAYDAHLEHAAEVATIGHSFAGTLGWSYPPQFLFVAALLASLPYTAAFLLWGMTTLGAYASVAATIAGRRLAFPVACAAPWVLTALMPGQNGFLTAALVGGVLLCLDKRPALAGVFLGLLSYKPQFGVLFPLVLAFAGYWRSFGWACVSTLLLNVVAGSVLGFETLTAFLHALSDATQSHLAHAGVGWNKLQSVYGLLRSMGAPAEIGLAAQALFSAAAAAVVVAYWRSKAPFALKAAVLACAIPLVTPYVFVYDLPVLSVACAFLFKHRNFDRVELYLLASTVPSVFAFLWLPFPTAFFASVAVATIAMRRALSENLVAPQFFRAPLQHFPGSL